ncbi:MAG: fumarylacetoacetate hydrolase, partial [Rhodobacteraceae bacterium]|nr:fumarylacetoacetate hydrolase [Paracoccaceae bacterium]
MKLATLPNGTPDGRLHVVTRDLTRCAPAQAVTTLQAAL